MKKALLLFATGIFYIQCYSQIIFEPGYFINENDQKTECLIKNMDWKNNPTQFEYKLSESDESKVATIETVKEFGIENFSKYIRRTVKIDRSSNELSSLSTDSQLVFNEETLFLNILVEGRANLYQYEDGNLIRFFYSNENVGIDQLIYKLYKVTNDRIATNSTFKNQLWNALKCSSLTKESFERLKYDTKDLIKIFVDYSQCSEKPFESYQTKPKRDAFRLNLRAGTNYSQFSTNTTVVLGSLSELNGAKFDSKLGLRFGTEVEFILPFNKNKWAIIIEPTYQYSTTKVDKPTRTATLEYKSIEVPIGVRHYFYLNEKDKLFANVLFLTDFSLDSKVDLEPGQDLEVQSGNNVALGFGYRHEKKIIELRYHTPRDLLWKNTVFSSEYKVFSIILGYSIL